MLNATVETEKIERILTDLIKPMRAAIVTNNPDTILATIRIIKQMVKVHPSLGESLIPYCRQFLSPSLNSFLEKKSKSTGDVFDYSQYRNPDLRTEILEMLDVLYKNGGSHAYWQIKLMIPTYEVFRNRIY